MSFQEELRSLSKTPQEAAEIQHNEDYQRGAEHAEYLYRDIKKKLLEKAEKGEYEFVDGKRRITLYYNDSWLGWCFQKKIQEMKIHESMGRVTVKESFFKRPEYHVQKGYFSLFKTSEYEGMVETLQKYGEPDRIIMRVVGYYNHMENKHKPDVFPVLGGSIVDFLIWDRDLSVRVECKVEY